MEETKNVFFSVYATFGICQSLTFLGGALAVYIGSLLASQKLHNQMLSRIMHAPVSFFETTPLGRIINRFGDDTEIMDSYVCWNFVEWISAVFQVHRSSFRIEVYICEKFANSLIKEELR